MVFKSVLGISEESEDLNKDTHQKTERTVNLGRLFVLRSRWLTSDHGLPAEACWRRSFQPQSSENLGGMRAKTWVCGNEKEEKRNLNCAAVKSPLQTWD